MNNRRVILACVVGFVAFVAAYWLYLLPSDVPPSPQYASPSESNQDAGCDQGSTARLDVADKNRSKPSSPRASSRKERRNSSPTVQQMGEKLAARLDDAVVRLRNDAASSTAVQYADGQLEMQASRPAAAIPHFERCLERDATFQPALVGKAAALVALQRFDEARSVYEQLIRLSPRDAVIRYNFGVLLYRESLFAEAAAQFQEAVRIDPTHARSHYNLATLAQREGRLSDAQEAWRTFTRLDPSVPSAWFNLGILWMDYELPIDAAYCFSQTVELTPNDADGWLNLALAQAAAGRCHLALEAATTADRLSPDNPLVLRILALLHRRLAEQKGPAADGHLEEAKRIETKYVTTRPDLPDSISTSQDESESDDESE